MDLDQVVNDDGISVARIAGRTYVLQEVACTLPEALQEAQQQYVHGVQTLREELCEQVWQQVDTAAHHELERISSRLQQHNIAVPSSMFKKPVVVMNSKVCPVRTVLYYIHCLQGRASAFQEGGLASTLRSKAPELCAALDNCSWSMRHLSVVFSASPVSVVSFALEGDTICTLGGTYHSYTSAYYVSADNHMWYKLCTGRASAKTFWAHPSFEDSVRVVNLDSPARRVVHFDLPSADFSFNDLLASYPWTLHVTEVDGATGAAVSAWTTQEVSDELAS